MPKVTTSPAHAEALHELAVKVMKDCIAAGIDPAAVYPSPEAFKEMVAHTLLEQYMAAGLPPDQAFDRVFGPGRFAALTEERLAAEAATVDAVSRPRAVIVLTLVKAK